MRSIALCWLAVQLSGGIGFAQTRTPASSSDKNNKQQQDPDAKQEPQPLFGGKIPLRSSQTTKESATLGFNGIDPSGKVDKRVLAASPKARDIEKVRNMDSVRPSPPQVIAFAKEGGLKTK